MGTERISIVDGNALGLVSALDFVGEVLDANRKAATIRHVITTGIRNRNGHRVVPEGGDMAEYRKNPIVLFGHDDSKPSVGKNLSLELEADRWIASTEFAPTDFGRELFALYDGGFMRSWSIGYRPIETTLVKNDEGDVIEIVYSRWRLLEYSAVPIPANPDAVTIAHKNGLISDSTLALLSAGDSVTREVVSTLDAPGDPGFPSTLDATLDAARLDIMSGSIRTATARLGRRRR